jgi:hypothetical protein
MGLDEDVVGTGFIVCGIGMGCRREEANPQPKPRTEGAA